MNGDRLLLVKGAEGLGNRILCFLTAILYAGLTERRLLVDWSDTTYSNDGSNVFHRFFQCPLFSPTDAIPTTDSVSPNIWRGHLHESARDMVKRYPPSILGDPEILRRFSIDISKLDYKEDVLVMVSFFEQVYILRRHFRRSYKALRKASTKAILKGLLRENLKLHPLIQERVDRFKRDWLDQKTVGVHIRYMDKKARLPAIQGKLNALLKREPKMQIFLATDNIEINKMFQGRYRRVISTQKWYPTSGRSMHHNLESPDRLKHGIEALLDMYLLAECDYLILDESSSFSYLASLLTNTSSSNIFNVQRGHFLPPYVRHLIWLLKIRLQKRLNVFGKISYKSLFQKVYSKISSMEKTDRPL